MLEKLPPIPLFANLNERQRAALKSAFESYFCVEDEIIFEQGEKAEYLYLILRGKALLSYKPYDGQRITLSRLKDGDVFGWSAAVGGTKYTSSVVSATKLEAVRIHRQALLDLLAQDLETGKLVVDRLALSVSPRWHNAYEQIQHLFE
ncbi:MAG: cyclic nucleotide-binding domain-containing protein [Anaerolineales bacterium]|nr:cyclic nucleotide-binding domain-containing protein [Anaerolineales bacterium]